MSDTAQSVLIFFLVLSPLYIPIAVTIVAAITDWRETTGTESRSIAASSRTPIAGEEPQPLPGNGYISAPAPNIEAA